MKRKHLTLLLVLFGFSTLQAQITYVKHDASGDNNGSSWDNAYTDLSVALGAVTAGEIWVAAGTYKPGSGNIDSLERFMIGANISLYGGFAGTESSLEERDVENNVTHLDGDLSGDDVEDDFGSNKLDNSLHVIYVDSLLNAVVIDGFTITGGHGNEASDDLDSYYESGGGIYANSPVSVNHCTFRQNFSARGAAIITNGIETSGSLISNCIFENNLASSSGIAYLFNQTATTVEFCEFRDNITNRGSLYPNTCANISVNNCIFENNTNPTGYSAGMWAWQNVGLTVTDCNFTGNSGTNAGAFYVDGRDIETPSASDVIFTGCTFDGNTASIDGAHGWGGALFFWQAGFTIIECTFDGNTALNAGAIYIDGRDMEKHQTGVGLIEDCTFADNGASLGASDSGRGGAIYSYIGSFTLSGTNFETNFANSTGGAVYGTGDSKSYIIEDCNFLGNSATWSGALTNYSDDTFVDIIDCEFEGNIAENGGGAMSNGFKAATTIEGTLFNENAAGWGGAVFNQNDTTAMTMTNCEVYGNLVNSTGGGVYSTGKIPTNISGTIFEGNQSDFGGGIAVFEGDVDGAVLNVTDCRFNLNIATQGAGINISNTDANITSSLFSANIAEDPGTGGGISTNCADSTDLQVNITNSTFVLNFGTLAGGIAAWEEGDHANSVTNLQNNIFFNPGFNNYTIEDGAPELVSLGGNFSTDNSMDMYLTHEKDISGEGNDPGMVDADDEDYHLAAGSPCIDAGVNEGAPEFDIEGTPRFGDVDMGAYEFDPTSSVKETVLENNGQLKVAPNPAVSNVEIQLTNDWTGIVTMNIVDVEGRMLKTLRVVKFDEQLKQMVDVSNLPAGNYELIANDGTRVVTAAFVKL
ncbi:MAG: T9SS C-terminal target domain-containing protein [Bacteroidetes bacterium]|nr:MAG: T9SS C-terminal target domain-containing protein [Bacteroidota bacterium]